MSIRRQLFRYTVYDAIPVLCALANISLLLASLAYFRLWPTWALAAAFVGLVICYCWNVQSISHNFIHNPFFVSTGLNRGFSILESVAIGIPQTIYHHYHLNHHWGDNDAQGPDGSTRDWGSTYRHGKNGQPESFWSYCLVGFFRFELGPCFRMIGRTGPKHVVLVLAETAALLGFWLAILLTDWRAFLYFYLPSYYLGWVLVYAHTYCLHYGALPGNYFANSVSSYHHAYNLWFFNNGYHQEHHWDPKAHWTRMNDVRKEILPQMAANGTRILRGPHITALIETWLEGRRSRAASTRPPQTAGAAKITKIEREDAAA